MTKKYSDMGDTMTQHSRAARLGSDSADTWVPKIEALLKERSRLASPIHVENVRPVEGGAGNSSGTLLFDAATGSGTVPCVLRFAPDKPLFHSYDLASQVGIQSKLEATDIPVPPQVCADVEGQILSVGGYVMQRLPGAGASVAWAESGAIADATPDQRSAMMNSFITMLAKVHAVDYEALDLMPHLQRAAGDAPIAREVNWYWDSVLWHGNEAVTDRLRPIRDWLITNEPEIARPVLCHGDSNLTNYLFVGDEISGVLDWEMAFLGTPECDLTWLALAMTSMYDQFPEGVTTIDELFREYERASGRKLENLAYYDVFSYYRTDVILELAKPHFPPDFLPEFSAYSATLTEKLLSKFEKASARTG